MKVDQIDSKRKMLDVEKTKEEEYQSYADEFHKYTSWFNRYVKSEKEKYKASYNNALSELKTEKKAREILQTDLGVKNQMIKELKEENESLKAQLKKATEKKLGQKSQNKIKCVSCDADSKFKVKGMMVCSFKCGKEAKPTPK